MAVFVLDKHKQPLMPCSEKRARLLLSRKRAVVHRLYPFTLRLKDRLAKDSASQPLRLKFDPGSKATGVAITLDVERAETVKFLGAIQHRGSNIRDTLTSRRAMRRGRRSRKTRYRAPRFDNRCRPKGWLAPSLKHRVDTVRPWTDRLMGLAPIAAISQELVRFDMQQMEKPEISGIEYQQGTLAGYELREYLLEKWGRQCAYCGAKAVPLEQDHIVARSRGGSNRASNFAISCRPCNEDKGSQPVEVFLRNKPDVLKRVLAQAKAPLRDAAAVNAARWALATALNSTGLPVEFASGGRTKFNRHCFEIPKAHALDAACVGKMAHLDGWEIPTLNIQCKGRGSYKRTRLNKHGFPRGYLIRQKRVKGFQTGDMVKAVVPGGKNAGTHVGRVAVRASGSFNIQAVNGVVQGISHKHCRILQRGDGYGYSLQPKIATTEERRGAKAEQPDGCGATPPRRERRGLSRKNR